MVLHRSSQRCDWSDAPQQSCETLLNAGVVQEYGAGVPCGSTVAYQNSECSLLMSESTPGLSPFFVILTLSQGTTASAGGPDRGGAGTETRKKKKG